MKHLSFRILVVGGGPAGLAAASSAARSVTDIGLIDDNPAIGGQIWRGSLHSAPTRQARYWFERSSTITILNRSKVIAQLEPNTLIVETTTQTLAIHFERLILATGARELFLPFPGWTLPGVMGAGGLQALVKGGLPVRGKCVVVAGSGPLLLAVAAYLKQRGALVRMIAEQTSWQKFGAFGLHLVRYPHHIGQAGQMGMHLLGVPLRTDCWVSYAQGTDRLETVTLRHGSDTITMACDYLACGFGLVPNAELATALGCAIDDGRVRVNEWQQSSVENIYCAGEVTGIGGVDLALAEGEIAGLAAAERFDEARACISKRERARGFAALLARSFVLRDELKNLVEDDTIVCRCEDVRYRDVRHYTGWRGAKLYTRCGMGPCQGRLCGAALTFLCGWTPVSVRPPLSAARITSLIQPDIETSQQQKKEVEL